jgi:hypothetical protein
MQATKALLQSRAVDQLIPDFDHFWMDFHRFVELKHAHGVNREQIFSPVITSLSYDFERWLASDDLCSPQQYRFDQSRQCEFRLSDECAQELESALAVWTYELKGLTKLVTRIRITSQIREMHFLPKDGTHSRSEQRAGEGNLSALTAA